MIDRIANQYALFSVVSDPSVLLSDILKTQHIPCRKIVIPKETKLEIRDKLDYINISERMIYPGWTAFAGGSRDGMPRSAPNTISVTPKTGSKRNRALNQ